MTNDPEYNAKLILYRLDEQKQETRELSRKFDDFRESEIKARKEFEQEQEAKNSKLQNSIYAVAGLIALLATVITIVGGLGR